MTLVREAWTDERLDDLNQRVTEGFADVRAELRAEIGSVRGEIGTVRGEIGSVRAEIGSVRGEVASLRNELNGLRSEITVRFDSLQRTLIYCVVSFTGVMVAGFAAIATQL